MKKFTLILFIAIIGVATIFAQTPQAFKYQTVVRNNLGDLITNQIVSFRIGIIQNSISGIFVYSETHIDTTNQFGLVLLEIGTGTVEFGVFEDIGWGDADHYLNIEFDQNGGANYQFIGTSQLLSVPYSLLANEVINDKDEQTFSVSGDTLFIENGNYVILPGVAPVITFICGDILTDIDGNNYATVQIGSQCWMAENLNKGTMINPINGGTNNDGDQTDNGIIEKYCYDNNTTDCDTYGGVYQWDEMMQYVSTSGAQGICPTGWHVPSDDEFKTLEMELGMTQAQADDDGWRGTNQGSQLAGNIALWNTGALENNPGFNTSGFVALPGGYRSHLGGMVNYKGINANFWSSTEVGSEARHRNLHYDKLQVGRGYWYKTNGYSVRCVKD